MKRTINNILSVFVITGLSFGFGLLCGAGKPLLPNPLMPAPLSIPTFIEIQTMLTNAGYDIGEKGLDGWIGRDTLKAWDLALCNQSAEQYFGKDK